MIEIEIKFKSSPENTLKLIDGADFLHEKIVTDTYYDTSDYKLTTNNQWLRSRNSKFEFKVPPNKDDPTNQFHFLELETDQEILTELGLDPTQDLAEALTQNSLLPFCTCKTTRKTYKKGDFTIVLDQVDFRDFAYELAEIELMIEDESQTDLATQKIHDFAKEIGLDTSATRGKILEYLYQVKPEHFQALVSAGITTA